MANFVTLRGVDCVGEAYVGQNYLLKFEDEEKDYTACTIEAENWNEVLDHVERNHADDMPLEIESC